MAHHMALPSAIRGERMGERHEDDPPQYYAAHLFVCCNRRPDGHPRGSCAARGSEKLRDYMKVRAKELGLSKVRVNMAGCLDRCEDPEGVWYKIETTADVDAVLQSHVVRGERLPALMLPRETR
jgi:(2Fe-2S) ferredoxin